MTFVLAICVGIAAGILSGLLGIGGGILVVPALVYLFGLKQHMAHGTTLAMMVPPIGLLAAWTYFRAGNVHIRMALLLALGFFFGGFLGAKAAHLISDAMLRRIFGCVMLLVAVKMIFGR